MSERDVRNRRAGARLVAVVERDRREALLALLAVVARVVRRERRLGRTTEQRHLDFGGADEVSAFDVAKWIPAFKHAVQMNPALQSSLLQRASSAV